MPYQYILANLLAADPAIDGVLFVDDNGESVEVACADGDPNEMRVLGAYLQIYLAQLDRFLGKATFGEQKLVQFDYREKHVFVRPLVDGYSLILAAKTPAMTAKCRRAVDAAAEQLLQELFVEH